MHGWTLHSKGINLVTETNRTLTRQIADGIRAKIVSGEYKLKAAIPSTPKLQDEYGASKTPVRDAVKELKEAGILEGQPGKAVYVKAVPDAAATEKHDIETLSKRIDKLEQRAEETGDLHDKVSQLEADLIELLGKNGLTYQDRRARHG